MNRCKLLAFRIIIVLMAPIFMILVLELGLRVAGFGSDTNVFIEEKGTVRSNWAFTFRYFPWSMARPMTPVRFTAEKPANALRIFVLGGSAAQGFPEEEYGIPAQLQVFLEQAHPNRKIEVINAAITAVNSHVVLPVARACLEYDPDFLVVYLGNNEVVGPYGAGTVFSRFRGSLALIRAGSVIKSSRLFQMFLRLSGRHLSPAGAWKGMQAFLQNTVYEDDPRLRTVYRHLNANIRDILAAARNESCPVILSTVGVNLLDNPPFASREPDFTDENARHKWKENYDAAEALLTDNRYAESASSFEALAVTAPDHAETRFLLGLSYLGGGNSEIAKRTFTRSRDLDGLRFRADSFINDIIRKSAAADPSGNTILADAERLLAESEASFQGIAGDALFFDHVHPTFAGNYTIAKAIAEAIISKKGLARAALPTMNQMKSLLAFSTRDGFQVASTLTDQLLNKPPFTNQWGHANGQLRRKRALRQLAAQLTPKAWEAGKQLYRDALNLKPKSRGLRMRFSRYLEAQGEKPEALKVLRALIRDFPNDFEGRLRASSLAAALGDYEEAEENLLAVLEVNPYAIEVREAYLRLLYDSGEIEEAVRYCASLVDDHPGDPDIRFVFSLVLDSQGKAEEALQQLRQAVRLDPGHPKARDRILRIFSDRGDTAAGRTEARAWIAANPQSSEAQFALAELLSQGNDYDGSAERYRTAMELDPDYVTARSRYVQTMAQQGRIHEAIELLDTQLDDDPDILEGYSLLGLALDVAGRKSEAVRVFRSGLKREPKNPKILRELAWILATAKIPPLRNGAEAVRLARKAVANAPGEADFHHVLAAAHAENRQFELAIASARRGIQLAHENNQTELRDFIRQCLGAYERGQPLRAD